MYENQYKQLNKIQEISTISPKNANLGNLRMKTTRVKILVFVISYMERKNDNLKINNRFFPPHRVVRCNVCVKALNSFLNCKFYFYKIHSHDNK